MKRVRGSVGRVGLRIRCVQSLISTKLFGVKVRIGVTILGLRLGRVKVTWRVYWGLKFHLWARSDSRACNPGRVN